MLLQSAQNSTYYAHSYIIQLLSKHSVMCHAAQKAGVPHCEYIYRKKENVIFTPL